MLPPVNIVLLAAPAAPSDTPLLVDIIQFVFYSPPVVDIKPVVVMSTVFHALLAAFVNAVIVWQLADSLHVESQQYPE